MSLAQTIKSDKVESMDTKTQAQSLDSDSKPISPAKVEYRSSAGREAGGPHARSAYAPNDVAHEILGQAVPQSRHLSVVGRTLSFNGDLSADEDLLIQGRVTGTIKHRAKNLTIGAHGDVSASIAAQNVIILGKVDGEICASESVVIEPSARVTGDIFAPRVGLKEGANFKGSIDMDPDPVTKSLAKSEASKTGNKKSAKKSTAAEKADEHQLSESEVDESLN